MASTDQTLRELAAVYVDLARQAFGERLRGALIFGSVARGEAHRGSDIDILLVARGLAPGRMARAREVDAIDELIEPRLKVLRDAGWHVEINAIWRTPEEAATPTPLYFDMTEDALILFDPDGLLGRTLAALRERMTALGARRERIGAARIWHLKPDLAWGEDFEL